MGTAASAEAFPGSDSERVNSVCGSENASEVCLGTGRVTINVYATRENGCATIESVASSGAFSVGGGEGVNSGYRRECAAEACLGTSEVIISVYITAEAA